jgi:hypothetical protein
MHIIPISVWHWLYCIDHRKGTYRTAWNLYSFVDVRFIFHSIVFSRTVH